MNDDLDVVAFAEQRYADWPNGIRANMVMSLDGAAVFRGRVGPLSSSADQRLFHALRAMADVILVGAGTARVEEYGPAVLDDELGALRTRQLGASATPAPRMAVVTRSCSVPAKSLGHLPGVRPIVITTSTADTSPATELADVIVAGDVQIDFARVVDELRSRGLRRILCEGGPTLLSALTEAGLVDELCLTLAPMLTAEPASVGSDSVVPSTNPLRAPLRTTLRHSVTHDDYIFLRYAQRSAP
ncbi:pyrimidine reductase family protein [Gordonia insulae]|uniref:2,5-diamino-6-ribosylamino-4(3H)-pyrimidinone 5'-phosphate reductase n=1 Tax=Gordonia insulae TaxID=2420509 RepID=A0A3G8JVB8_9ACTN|nr:pyrimidine reductase family protein [Gordonia insulae]AZG48110.1 2,5-diamino-6-ribosylamino-4(3H)-pyrimidinone 5'-phosphate reductase [Gordonia insulae]